jgi:N-acetyl sugar amidotransferase
VRFCSRCVLPNTRPCLTILDSGICSACAEHERRASIDWDGRAAAFTGLCRDVRTQGSGYDCVIPVSGGKDSTWQVVTALEHGLRPLAATWKSPGRTPIGARNLANLVSLGVDHVDYQINPHVERTFMRDAFRRFGSTAIPMHLALFAIPMTLAVRFRIPLVLWGEDPGVEYCGELDHDDRTGLGGSWIAKQGVSHGTTAADWVGDVLSEKELAGYFGPTDAELDEARVTAIFLGHFFRWDPARSFEVARQHGFEANTARPRTGIYDFADIDDDFISIHHYVKWLKFGLTRSFDNLSLEIRNGRLSRSEAIEVLRGLGDERPNEDIDRFCEFAEIGRAEFDQIAETYRNREIWTQRDGTWLIEGFLVPDWRW